MTLVLLHSAWNPGRKNQPQGLNGMINAQLTDKKFHSDALTFKRSFYSSPLLFDSVWSDRTVPARLLCLALPTYAHHSTTISGSKSVKCFQLVANPEAEIHSYLFFFKSAV